MERMFSGESRRVDGGRGRRNHLKYIFSWKIKNPLVRHFLPEVTSWVVSSIFASPCGQCTVLEYHWLLKTIHILICLGGFIFLLPDTPSLGGGGEDREPALDLVLPPWIDFDIMLINWSDLERTFYLECHVCCWEWKCRASIRLGVTATVVVKHVLLHGRVNPWDVIGWQYCLLIGPLTWWHMSVEGAMDTAGASAVALVSQTTVMTRAQAPTQILKI